VVGEASDGAQVLKLVASQRPDVLLLDLQMPGPGFMEVLEQVRALLVSLKVLVLSAHAEDQYARRVLRAGAVGYITKNHSPEELVAAVRRVAGGARYVSQAMAERLAADLAMPERSPQEMLSNREYQVLALLGRARASRKLPRAPSCRPRPSVPTAPDCCRNSNLKTTADLIRYALEHSIGT